MGTQPFGGTTCAASPSHSSRSPSLPVPVRTQSRHRSLLRTRPVGSMRCTFRTAAAVHLWPFTVAGARWVTPDAITPPIRGSDAVGALRIELRAFAGVDLSTLAMESIRLHLHGDGPVASTLHEVLCRDVAAIFVRSLDEGKAATSSRNCRTTSAPRFPMNVGLDRADCATVCASG